MQKRIPGLDGIRALSIMLVLFFHVSYRWISWSINGAFGVEIFFVVSGFLITWLLCVEEDKRGEISLPSFYIRRALRILPPAYLFIAVVSVLSFFGWASIGRAEPLYATFFVRNLMPNDADVHHLGHFWSLAIEEQFYLVWPPIFLLLKTNQRRLIFAGSLFLIAPFWKHLAVKLAGGPANVNFSRFDLHYDALVVGCCLALIRHEGKLLQSQFFRSAAAAILALALIVAGRAGLPSQGFADSLSYVGVALFINVAIQRTDGIIGFTLNAAPIVWIGQLSYSLYLWQQIFCWKSRIPWLGEFPQNVVAALAAAALSFYALEQPLAAVRKRVPYFPNPIGFRTVRN